MSRRFAALVAALTIVVSSTPHAAERMLRPTVPSNLEVADTYKVFLHGHAVGTQNYICAPAGTASGVDWLFIGPQATVFDDEGRQILTHFQSRNPFKADAIQATWQHSGDTSAAWARKFVGSTDSNYVSPDAIEWLLLEVTGSEVGPLGGTKLSGAAFIQRVNTIGGKPPATADCTPSVVNTRKLVSYEADYYFYR